MSDQTGYYDVRGIPIHVGDLIRVKHYRHILRRTQMWLYFRVANHPLGEGRPFVVQNWSEIDPTKWQCLLNDCGLESAEVLDEVGLSRGDNGCIVTFNERKRKRNRRSKKNTRATEHDVVSERR